MPFKNSYIYNKPLDNQTLLIWSEALPFEKSDFNVQPVLIFTKKVGDKDFLKSPFQRFTQKSHNQSQFTMSYLCIQTGNTISKLNVFSNRDRAEGGIPKWPMIKNNTLGLPWWRSG